MNKNIDQRAIKNTAEWLHSSVKDLISGTIFPKPFKSTIFVENAIIEIECKFILNAKQSKFEPGIHVFIKAVNFEKLFESILPETWGVESGSKLNAVTEKTFSFSEIPLKLEAYFIEKIIEIKNAANYIVANKETNSTQAN